MTGGKAVQVVFAANNSAYRKRKRAHRACEQCKSRRRKCPPPFENHERCASCAQDGIQCSLALIDSEAPQTTTRPTDESRNDNDDPVEQNSITDKNPRFIGDLNPESVFLTVSGDSASAHEVATDRNEVGVWVSQSPEPLSRHKGAKRPRFQDQESSKKPTSAAPAAEGEPEKHLNAYLTSLSAYALPTRPCMDLLLGIYENSIHPLFPIIDDATCALFKRTPDKIPIVLLQSILLVASRHADAAAHLRLSASGELLKPCEFSQRLETRIKALIYADDERNRMNLIRVYALLSLGGGNESSRNLAMAIHHAHSLGLHISNSKAEELWWCLWTLDKLQAAMNGRPILVKLEDVSIDRPSKVKGGRGAAFRIMVKLAGLLESVIALYRPGNESDWEKPFPDFQSYLQDEEVPEGGQLVVLKLIYCAISILSHRTRTQNQIRSNSYIRRLNAAKGVITIFRETKIPLPPTPILPYALSLALTTFYAQVREGHGKCMEEYSYCIEKLTYYSEWWWVAGAMAKLGSRAISNSGHQKRAVEEKECAAVLSSLKSTGEDPKNTYGSVHRERIVTHKVITPGSTRSSPPSKSPLLTSPASTPPHGPKRHPIYAGTPPIMSMSPIIENIPLSPYTTYDSALTMGPPIMHQRTYVTSSPQFYTDQFLPGGHLDSFLLDQFSNPGNPVDFDGFNLGPIWIDPADALHQSNYGLGESWNSRNDGTSSTWAGG